MTNPKKRPHDSTQERKLKMKILLPADGSSFTKKALAFLVTHENICGPSDELIVVNVQPPIPPRVQRMVGATTVREYHSDEATKVLKSIERFLTQHKLNFRTSWVAGSAATEILKVATKEKVHLIVMGTHGHGVIGRAVMGSVAQRVLAEADIPVLLVK
jgi:nucleotide-binding universal stress UspA family protein